MVVVLWQKSKPFLLSVKPEIRSSPWTERILIGYTNTDTNKLAEMEPFASLCGRQTSSYGEIKHHRTVPRIERELLCRLKVLNGGGEISKREREQFYPTFINAVMGRSNSSVEQFNLHSWREASQVICWVAMWFDGNMGRWLSRRTSAFNLAEAALSFAAKA